MKTKYGFIMFDDINEFENWLKNQKISRRINKLQVHHMALPDYDCFYKSNGTTEDELTRTINLNSYGVSKGWGCIAQHFNIFPNGKITTGRDINKTPVGITGWNTNKICIEIYGNFDHKEDNMTEEQRKAVIAVYGILCKKLNITPSTSTIRPHAWFASDGTYLGDYVAGKSRKTCPGTNFMGFGNTKSAFVNNFYPLIKQYMARGQVDNEIQVEYPVVKETAVNQFGYVDTLDGSKLNIRLGAGTQYKITGSLENKAKVYIVASCDNGWLKIKSGGYVSGKYVRDIENIVNNSSGKYIVRYLQQTLNTEYRCGLVIDGVYGAKTKSVVSSHAIKNSYRGEHVLWLQKALVNRGYKISVDGICGPNTIKAVKDYQASRKLTADGIAGLNTHTAIIND